MNILIVDDSKFNLFNAKDVIEQHNIKCSITLSQSGREAIDVINSKSIDIVLLDIIMPNMSGIDVLNEIKGDTKNRNLIVLMLTSLTDKQYLRKSFELGAADYINKPIEPVEFISRLKSAIKIKEFQNALLESYNHLKNTNAQLKESNIKLRKTQMELINREKLSTIGRFSAGVAHEINTPLGYVISNLSTIKKYSNTVKDKLQLSLSLIKDNDDNIKDKLQLKNIYSDEKKLDYIFSDFDDIIEETNEGLLKIDKIIKNLIRFTHENGEDEIQLNKFSEIINETNMILKSELNEYNLQETVDIKFDLTNDDYVNCNRLQIEQVIFNIISNAVHFINGEGRKGEIYIKTYSEDSYFCCDIKDNGPGIKEDAINRVFEPFFTTKDVGEGIGLGLSVAYDIIVNKHKGNLTVESILGEGATFCIKIPI